MERTEEVDEYVRSLVRQYSEYLGMRMPLVACGSAGHGRRLGYCYRSDHMVVVCVENHVGRHDNMEALHDTVAHECCHLAYPRMRHGVQFDRLIQEVLTA